MDGQRRRVCCGGAAVPWHLTTSEFIEEIERVLRPDGLYAMNLIDGGPNDFAAWQVRTLLEHFAHVAVMGPVGGLGDEAANQVVLASDASIDRFALRGNGAWMANVAEFAAAGRRCRGISPHRSSSKRSNACSALMVCMP